MAVIILSDPRNGFPLCIMDGTAITNMRTGAAGGIAAKYLARKDSSIVGLVGCGAQAASQLDALKRLFRIRCVRVWGKQKLRAKKFLEDIKDAPFEVAIKDNIRDCVKDADIVVTTTPTRRPIVKAGWIRPGAHINAIGADAQGKEELEPALLKVSKIIVDDRSQASHSGEINVPLAKGIISEKDIHGTLGEVVTGKKEGRTSSEEITIFDSTGLAIQDVAAADLVYKKALKKKIGRHIVLLSLLSALILAPSISLAAGETHLDAEAVFNVPFGDGKKFEVAAGEEVVMTLDSNPTTGYGWALASPLDEKVLELARSEYVPNSTLVVGSGGREIWTFRAVGPGRTKVSFKYVRPWEKDAPPAKTEEFTVMVKESRGKF
jgi:alanine dehydrogenase